MKLSRLTQMITAAILCVALMPLAAAEAPVAPAILRQEQKTDFGLVAYPALANYEDELTQVTVNLLILERGEVEKNSATLLKQDAKGFGMEADYEAMLESGLLSIVFSTRGDLGNRETGQKYETLNYDLENGREITLDDVFSDVAGAVAFMEETMQDKVAPILSGYAVNEEVTPLPKDRFALTKEAITFYYDAGQFSMQSGYAGSASFFYYELEPFLNLEEGSVLKRLSADTYLDFGLDSKEKIAACVEAGTLPGITTRLMDMLSDAFKKDRLFCDPDYYPNARFYQLEAGHMRGIVLLSDLEKRSYDEAPVIGIRADRMNLFGIKVSVTTRDEWRRVLGPPDETVALDAYTAQDFYLCQGMSDYYTFGENRLRLHADDENVLQSLEIIR